jgi:hypothetical protein
MSGGAHAYTFPASVKPLQKLPQKLSAMRFHFLLLAAISILAPGDSDYAMHNIQPRAFSFRQLFPDLNQPINLVEARKSSSSSSKSSDKKPSPYAKPLCLSKECTCSAGKWAYSAAVWGVLEKEHVMQTQGFDEKKVKKGKEEEYAKTRKYVEARAKKGKDEEYYQNRNEEREL